LGRFVVTACNTVEASPSCNTLYIYFFNLQALNCPFFDSGRCYSCELLLYMKKLTASFSCSIFIPLLRDSI
jgi:hypothetical protein